MSTTNNQRILLLILFFIISLSVVNLQFELTRHFFGLRNLISGQANPIFTSRAFTRILLKIVTSEPFYFSPISANYILQTVFLSISMFIVFLLGEKLYSSLYGLCSALICATFLPWGFLSSGYSISYPYDLVTILFFALGYFAIFLNKDLFFYLVILFGTLNKETIILLIPISIFYKIKLTKKFPLAHLFTSLLLYFLTYFAIRYTLFGASSIYKFGTFFSLYQQTDLRFYLNLQQFSFPFSGNYYQWIYFPVIIYFLPLLRFQKIHPISKYAYLSSPIYLLPILFFGNINEFRLLNELLVVAALSLPILVFNE